MKQLLNNSSIKTSDEYFDSLADVRAAQRTWLQVISTAIAHSIMFAGNENNVALFCSTVQTSILVFYVHLLGTNLSSQTLIGNCGSYFENAAFLELKWFRVSKRRTQAKPSTT